jgi:23S rRNA pseudouridine1911/1915/1917 synthase
MPGTSLLDWLLQKFPETPKTRAKQWILAGRVTVAGEVVRRPQQLMEDPGESLQLGGRHAPAVSFGPAWKIHPRVTLLHIDSSLAVVDKGPGLVSVPAPNAALSALSILSDFLAGKLRARERLVSVKTLPPVFRRLQLLPVHRLDQFTSGVFCMATSPQARENLIGQLQSRSMHREYIAFAEGRSASPSGTWRNWLQLSRDEMRQNVVHARPNSSSQTDICEAITHFEVLEEYPLPSNRGFVTKLKLRLETGRKHQIRAQAAHAGLPLVGDRVYNAHKIVDFSRQALHAAILKLIHPEHPGETRTWEATLARDLRQLETALREGRVLLSPISAAPRPTD